MPGIVAFTTKLPALLLAVNREEVAIPLESVTAVVTFELVSRKVPPAPLPGAVKVTWTPAMGSPGAYWTITFRGSLKAWRICVDCGEPLLTKTAGGTLVS